MCQDLTLFFHSTTAQYNFKMLIFQDMVQHRSSVDCNKLGYSFLPDCLAFLYKEDSYRGLGGALPSCNTNSYSRIYFRLILVSKIMPLFSPRHVLFVCSKYDGTCLRWAGNGTRIKFAWQNTKKLTTHLILALMCFLFFQSNFILVPFPTHRQQVPSMSTGTVFWILLCRG